jgi:DNA-binding HxlR family transcriptional regulator
MLGTIREVSTRRRRTEIATRTEPEQAYGCEIEAVLAVVGGKWKLFILWNLRHGTLRYAQLRHRIEGISERVLIKQLRELEADGMVHREQYPEVPPRVEYSLTERGHSFGPAIESLADWGRQHAMGKLAVAAAVGSHRPDPDGIHSDEQSLTSS